MLKVTLRWQVIFLSMAILLALSGCYNGLDDQLEITAIAFESPTPEPATATNTPEPIVEEVEATDQLVAQISESDTPTPTETNTPTVTPSPTDEPVEVVQIFTSTPVIDTYQLTATELIRQATERAGGPTLTAAALQAPTETNTPTPPPTVQTIIDTNTQIDTTTNTTNTNTVVLTGADCVHEVRAGENMFRLSLYYGVSINEIAAYNSIVNPRLIIVGQKIIIPGCGTTGALPPPTSVPTATAQPAFSAAGGSTTINNTTTTTTITNTGACGSQYIVQQYDTLFQISLRCGVPIQSIANANGITNINFIDIGAVLTIPAQ